MPVLSPYEKCPVYETESFILRLVEESDANDLLECYSDREAVKVMNSDNCNSDFHFKSLDEMTHYIRVWLAEYASAAYVRLAIVAKAAKKAVGTIEIFGREGADDQQRVGVLRIDLCASYEDTDHIGELLEVATGNFYNAFNVHHVVAKAIPAATARVAALEACGFTKLADNAVVPYDHYYIK